MRLLSTELEVMEGFRNEKHLVPHTVSPNTSLERTRWE
jgi:hypothetical protein